MADVRYIGTAAAVAQVDTFTPATIEVDDIFTLTVTGTNGRSKSISYTAVDTSATTVSGAIIDLWNAETDALFTDITASGTATVILTAGTGGDAFTVASSTTDGGGNDTQTFARVATTANGGPKDWRDVDNWDIGALPGGAAAQDVYIENFTGDIVYGLDQSGIGNTLASLNCDATFVGKLGDNGAAGTIGDYLQIPATVVNIGEHFGSGSPTGSPRIKINVGAVASTINVYKTGTSLDDSKPAVRLLANNAATDINVYRGSVGLPYESSETSSVNDILVSWINNRATDSSVFIDEGVTVGGSLTITGGTCNLQVAVATIDISSGTLKIRGSGATTTLTITGGLVETVSSGNITTVNMHSGAFTASSTGTIGTANFLGGTMTLSNTGNITTVNASGGSLTVNGTSSLTIGTVNAEGATIFLNLFDTITALTVTGGTVDLTGNLTARTVTTTKLDKGGRLSYDPGVVTFTNKVDSDNTVTLTAA